MFVPNEGKAALWLTAAMVTELSNEKTTPERRSLVDLSLAGKVESRLQSLIKAANDADAADLKAALHALSCVMAGHISTPEED